MTVAELCRKHGISDATFYKWQSRFGGMEESDAKRLKGHEEENLKLKKPLAVHIHRPQRANSEQTLFIIEGDKGSRPTPNRRDTSATGYLLSVIW